MIYQSLRFWVLFLSTPLANADMYLVHFANAGDEVEMVTVFSETCIATSSKFYGKYVCNEELGSLSISYYNDASCTVSDAQRVKTAIVFTNEWAVTEQTEDGSRGYSKRAQLFCSESSLSQSNGDMTWQPHANGGVVLHYYPSADDQGCTLSPSVSQYIVQDYCVQYSSSSGITVDANGELSEEPVGHLLEGDRELLNGQRIFATFQKDTDDSLLSAAFFTNGYCSLNDEPIVNGDDDGSGIGQPENGVGTPQQGDIASHLRGYLSSVAKMLKRKLTAPESRELYELDLSSGTCEARNMFLLTGIFTENHILASRVTAYSVSQLSNEPFDPSYHTTWFAKSSFGAMGYVVIGCCIGAALALLVYHTGLLDFRSTTIASTSSEKYQNLSVDSQHTTSPAAVERKLLSISPTSPDDELELASTNQERRLFDDSYGTLPVESTHSTMSLVSRADSDRELSRAYPLPPEEVIQTQSSSADSSDEILPRSSKVLQ